MAVSYPDPAPPPSGLETRDVDRVTPTLTAAGDAIDSVDRTVWGRLQVVVGGVDRTWLDDAPVEPVRWSAGQPFGDGPAVIRIASRDSTDAEVAGWVDDDAAIRVVGGLDEVDGGTPTTASFDELGDGGDETTTSWDVVWDGGGPLGHILTLWEGYVVSVEDADGGAATDLHCQGALYQVDEYVRAPLLIDFDLGIVDFIDAQLSQITRPHLRLDTPESGGWSWLRVDGDPPDRTTRKTGAWDAALTGYVRDVLERLTEADGTQWTLDLARNRVPRLRRVKPVDAANVDAVVDVRWPGVEPRLTLDASETVNVAYGEGTDAAGQVWRNADYESGIAVYDPLAHTDAAHPKDDNPAFDDSIIRRERHVQFGSGVSQPVGEESAGQIIDRESQPRWTGRIVLTVDPPEMSRFEVTQGMVLQVDSYRGQTLHVGVVEAQVDWANLSVSLTVDERARDLLTVAEAMQRRRDRSMGPVAQLRRGRNSEIVVDDRVPWDDVAGSGYLPRPAVDAGDPSVDTPTSDPAAFIEVSQGSWVVTRVFAAQKATIRATRMQLYDADGVEVAAPFYAAVFDGEVSAGDLDAPPLTVGHEWSSLPEGVAEIVGWGVAGQRAGYSPGLESDGDGQTGAVADDADWQIDLEPGQGEVWLAVWLDGGPVTAYLQGRLFQGVQ